MLLGDFDEIYQYRSTSHGRLDCYLWAYSQVLRSICPIIKQRLVEAYSTVNVSRSDLASASGLVILVLSVPLTLFLLGAAPDYEYFRNANDDTYAGMLLGIIFAVGLEVTAVFWCGITVVTLFEEKTTKLWLVLGLLFLLWITVCVTGYFLWTSGKLTSFWYRIVFLEFIGPWLGLTAFVGVSTLCLIDKYFDSKQLRRGGRPLLGIN